MSTDMDGGRAMPSLVDRRWFVRSIGMGLTLSVVEAGAQPFPTIHPTVAPPAAKVAWINFEFAITWERVNVLQEVVTNLIARGITTITLMLSSTGGEITAALSMYNFLTSVGIKLTTYNIGNTYSAAVLVFLAGERRVADRSAQFIIHPSSAVVGASALSIGDLNDRAESLGRDTDRVRDIYVARTKITKEQGDAMLHKLTFIDTARALELGILTEVGHLDRPASATLITLPISTFHGPSFPAVPTGPVAPPAAPATTSISTPPPAPPITAPQ
jgi:ATP-dependent protease ClpP protease subunit